MNEFNLMNYYETRGFALNVGVDDFLSFITCKSEEIKAKILGNQRNFLSLCLHIKKVGAFYFS